MRDMRWAALLSTGIVLVAGCGRKQTYYAPGGKVTVSEQRGGKSVQVKTEKGTATLDTAKKSITEAELGAPVYPGAAVELSSTYAGSDTGKQESMQQNVLTTPDGFDRVYAFYKSKLKHVQNAMTQNTGDGQMGMFLAKAADGSDLTVQITTDKDKKLTRIHVLKAKQAKS